MLGSGVADTIALHCIVLTVYNGDAKKKKIIIEITLSLHPRVSDRCSQEEIKLGGESDIGM